MSKLMIEGSHCLEGELTVHGAKNSALPVLSATLLCDGESHIHNCPRLSDVDASVEILRYLGCRVVREGDTVSVNTDTLCRCDIPDQLMREMRSSIVFLGAVASRMGKAKLSFPGGCELGPRPIDLHLKALRQMGMVINEFHGYLDCSVPARLKGTSIALSFPSVGATENIILAAALAEGTTVVNNAAREPEICDLCGFLNACGARISGAGEGRIVIEGVEKLTGTEHHVIPDRIAATTFMTAAAGTGGGPLLGKGHRHLAEKGGSRPFVPGYSDVPGGGLPPAVGRREPADTGAPASAGGQKREDHAVSGLPYRRSGSDDGDDHGFRWNQHFCGKHI